MVTTSIYGGSSTHRIVTNKFDASSAYANEAVENANDYMQDLEELLTTLVPADTSELDDVSFGAISGLDYSSIPDFEEVLGEFPTFGSMAPLDPLLATVPMVHGTVPTKNFNFIANIPAKPPLNYGTGPGDGPTLSSIEIPPPPELKLPKEITIDDITVPPPPPIDIAKFDAQAPNIKDQADNSPTPFTFTEAPYNSDIRVALFNKILNDILNGGTGLDVTVEQEIWDRFLARQTAENDRLYQEVQDQFSATGFDLPSGAYASRLLQVSSEISMKNDQASRDIAIAQAELAQKNTQFTTEQAGILEKMLVDFFNAQQTRSLQAQQALASNAVEIYNAMVNRQNLLLEEYKTEAQVFETKVRAELAAIEIYRAEIEGVKATVEVQQARVNLYNSQVAAVELFLKIYQTEMESAKIQAEIQNLELGLFKTRTEAYVARIEAEKAKADVYKTEVSAEGIRADAFKSEVAAYEAEVKGRLGVIEAERIKATSRIAENQQRIDEYRAKIEKYRSEIDAEIRTASLAVSGYQANVSAYQATTGTKEVEYRARMAEAATKIEYVKAELQKAVAKIESETNSYVALKQLAVKGTEGLMNANAQLAASAMNAVSASASLGDSYGSSMGVSHNHSYDYEM